MLIRIKVYVIDRYILLINAFPSEISNLEGVTLLERSKDPKHGVPLMWNAPFAVNIPVSILRNSA